MLKMYLARERAGGEAGFWEEGWTRQALAEMVACCGLHPLRDPLARLLPTEGLILDGGCGPGAWSIYYARRGHRLVGVDFARGALRSLRAAAPRVPACAGRVDALPLAASGFAAYYSGGVVEHFEDGPEAALAEARRVLRPGGLLLLVVPDLSALRDALGPKGARLLYDGTRPAVGFERVQAPRAGPPPWEDVQFFQYLYRADELRPRLAGAGFEVLWDRGYGLQWALMELPAVQRLSARLRGPILRAPADYWDRVPQAPWAQEPLIPAGLPAGTRRLLRQAFTLEDDRVPLLGGVLRLLVGLASNLRLYVCRRR